mmetsp:Transcript_162988/g.522663  ORF Transcript_162988/g.522663 Transcript_162988/m.522663 type:complete len:122 (-) Transcript_162988:115-480(-)
MSDRDSQSAGDAEEHDVLNEALGGVDEALAGRLTYDQQERLDKTKIQINMENERYLQAHPEIKDMIGVFVHQAHPSRKNNPRCSARIQTRRHLAICWRFLHEARPLCMCQEEERGGAEELS